MSRYTVRTLGAVALLAAITACARADAEQAAMLAADSARAEGVSSVEVSRRATTARTVATARAVPRIRTRSLAAGTILHLAALIDVTSQKDDAGKPFAARTIAASLNAAGDTVIPVGAELVGRVTVLESAGSPGSDGSLEVSFSTIRFDGRTYPIETRVISLATRTVGRGVTGGDAAKIGVGAAAGAVAGRIIGGNATGTAVGAVVGGAAGGVYANRTKDHDIVLSPGSAIEVALTNSFSRNVTR